MSSLGLKRSFEQLGEEGLSAAVGEAVALTVSAAAGRYAARASAEDQVEHLGTLLIMVHSAVDAAEGFHIRSWWLRRWLARLRDAALEGDEVLRSVRRRRAAEVETDRHRQAGNTLWSAARRVLRSAKSLLFAVTGDDGGLGELSRMVARLETTATGIGDFVKLLELEIRRSLPAPSIASPGAAAAAGGSNVGAEGLGPPPPLLPQPVAKAAKAGLLGDDDDDDPLDDTLRELCIRVDELEFGQGFSSISEEEYTSSMREILLLLLRQKVRRAVDRLRAAAVTAPAPAPPPSTLDAYRLDVLVVYIREAARTGEMAEVKPEGWLARWRRELQAIADRGDDMASALAEEADGDETNVTFTLPNHDENALRRTAQRVETAAAHLGAFLALVRFAAVANTALP